MEKPREVAVTVEPVFEENAGEVLTVFFGVSMCVFILWELLALLMLFYPS